MRISHYITYIPIPQSSQCILLQGYSGAVDILSNEVVEAMRNGDIDHLCKLLTPQDLKTLQSRSYITERSSSEETSLLLAIAAELQKEKMKKLRVEISPSYACNMACPYCYENDFRRTLGPSRLKGPLSIEKIDAIFQTIALSEPDHNNVLPIVFLGGEPLMRQNREVIAYLLSQGKKQHYKFTIATNGVEFLEFIDLLDPSVVLGVQFTIDGPKEIHNNRRIYKADRASSFDRIVEAVECGLRKGIGISVRTNVDSSNLESVPELARFYHDRGWFDSPIFYAYCRAVYGFSHLEVDKRLAALLPDHPELLEVYFDHEVERVFVELIAREKPSLSPGFCAATARSLIFDPYGGLFTCSADMGIGRTSSKIGTWFPLLKIDDEVTNRWQRRIVLNMPECQVCPVALLHSGGCAYLSEVYGKNPLFAAYCEEFPERLQVCAPITLQRFKLRKQKFQSMRLEANPVDIVV